MSPIMPFQPHIQDHCKYHAAGCHHRQLAVNVMCIFPLDSGDEHMIWRKESQELFEKDSRNLDVIHIP